MTRTSTNSKISPQSTVRYFLGSTYVYHVLAIILNVSTGLERYSPVSVISMSRFRLSSLHVLPYTTRSPLLQWSRLWHWVTTFQVDSHCHYVTTCIISSNLEMLRARRWPSPHLRFVKYWYGPTTSSSQHAYTGMLALNRSD